MPLLIPTSFTFAFEYATSALICSSARPVRKHEAEQTKGIFPAFASPAPTPTRFCSAMPTFTSRCGNRLRNAPVLLEPTESLLTTTMRSSSSPSSSSMSENAWRQSWKVASVIAQLLERARELLARRHLVVPLGAVLH